MVTVHLHHISRKCSFLNNRHTLQRHVSEMLRFPHNIHMNTSPKRQLTGKSKGLQCYHGYNTAVTSVRAPTYSYTS